MSFTFLPSGTVAAVLILTFLAGFYLGQLYGKAKTYIDIERRDRWYRELLRRQSSRG